jgi:MFS family permease
VISVIPGIAAVLLTFRIRDRIGQPVSRNKNRSFFAFLSYWKRADRRYKFLVAGLLGFTLINSSDAFILLGLKQKGFSDTQVIGFYIFYNLIYAVTSYPIGRLSDKIGQRKIIVGGFILFAISYGLFGLATGMVAIAGVFVLYGVFSSSTEGISKALITNLSGKEDTATALGLYTSMASVCTLLASTVSGLIWATWSLKVMFLVSAAGALIVAGYLIVYFSLSARTIKH